MKYCVKCGKELMDEAVFCPGCGCAVETTQPVQKQSSSTFQTPAKVFMILGTVLMGFLILPLAWCIPMTIIYCNKVKNNQPISTGFKVCSLLFVSLLGGIFMLCDNIN